MIDVVVVAYRSSDHLRDCVAPLLGDPAIHVIVVDNDCPERSTDTILDLEADIVRLPRNVGFGAGCNAGVACGAGPMILFLNPDAQMTPDEVKRLAAVYEAHPTAGAVGPHILETSGEDQPSMRRQPRLRSVYGEALFLHQLLPHAGWPTEIVADGYDSPADAEWLSGAVLSVRRSAFEAVGGFDERFFMYCEDIDLCVRLREAGFGVRYDPAPTAVHAGGGSAPRPLQAARRVEAKITYARIHARGLRYAAFRSGFVLHELLRLPVAAVRSRTHLRGRSAALATALGRRLPELKEPSPLSANDRNGEVEVGPIG